ncbi:PAS domain-containing sensor histidine kinase [Thalassoroseus pseudoceratinae]|uniref:PAS domain-containing sensor histidine kinase n=1 Tax=Thalassoroseus pseudoceratinae TaxID=2713176 RepID=UPI00142367FF|nr:PAS domain S-box protein [Thalassoroseus pseudoceratinae]
MAEPEYWSVEQRRSIGELLTLVPPDQQRQAQLILNQIENAAKSDEPTEKLESDLQYFLDQANIGMWDWDLATDHVTYSRSWCRQLGLDPKDVSQTFDEFQSRLYPGDRETTQKIVTEAIRTVSNEYEVQFRLKHSDGGWRWILSKGFVVGDSDGKPVAMKGIHIDITDTKRAMRSLCFSQVALDEGNSKIFWIDISGNLIYVNNLAADWLGVSRQVAEQMSVFDITAITAESWANQIAMMRDRKRATFEFMIKARGTSRPVEIHATLVSYEDEDVLVSFLIDISDRLQNEANREFQSKQLMHAARLTTMGEMSATLSHELAQPISAIGNYADSARHYLKKLDLEDSTLESIVTEIGAQSERTVHILRRVRQFTKYKELARQSCLLNDLVEDSLAMVQHDLANSHVKVECDFQATSASVDVDRIYIQQVIINLLQNARDAVVLIDEQSRLITVSTHIENNAAVLRIQDSGSGVVVGEEDKIFEMFYTTKPHGVGIGLAICRSIINSHNGTLTLEKSGHSGALFKMTLPLESNGS